MQSEQAPSLALQMRLPPGMVMISQWQNSCIGGFGTGCVLWSGSGFGAISSGSSSTGSSSAVPSNMSKMPCSKSKSGVSKGNLISLLIFSGDGCVITPSSRISWSSPYNSSNSFGLWFL